MRKFEIIAAIAALAVASPVMAQGRGRGNGGIPPGQRPPAGMCRIWIDGVPPGHQPAPTDCGTAAARVPPNGRIIYGDGTYDRRGSIYDRSGRIIYGRNGGVIQPGTQRCVQRVDVNGHVYTECDNGTVNGTQGSRAARIYEGGQTGVSSSRATRVYDGRAAHDDRYEEHASSSRKSKHHKSRDRDGDHDRN